MPLNFEIFEEKTKKLITFPELRESELQEIAVRMSLSTHELFGFIEQEKAHCGFTPKETLNV